MRTSIALLSLGAALAAAQGLSSLPQCGQTCITNMLAIAPSLGCAQGNITCYCTQPAFGYGVRDCANEACSSSSQAAQVIKYGTAYCKKALAGGAGAGASSAASSVAASASASSVSSSSSASAAANATASGSSSSAPGLVAYTTSPLLETTKSGGSKVTLTTGTTTLSGFVSAETSVTKSGGSKITMTTGTTTITGAAGTKAAKAASKKKAKATSGGGSGGGSGGSGGSGGGSGGSGGGSGGSGGGSSGAGNTLTAAPALIGAMLLAVLAL